MNLSIRKGTEEDARSVVEVNTFTWLTTYKGLMPDEVLDERLKSMDERVPTIAQSIRENDDLYVAVDDDKVVGIMSYGKSRNDKYPDSGEMYSIYVLEEYQGLGLGKQLFITGVKALIDMGYNSMILNVLEGNKTISFYEKYSGVIVDTKTEKLGNTVIKEKVMYFEDLNKIKTVN